MFFYRRVILIMRNMAFEVSVPILPKLVCSLTNFLVHPIAGILEGLSCVVD